MLGRVTPDFMQSDFLNNTKKRDNNLQNIQKQLTSGMKVLLPSDDPANVVNYMKWESKSQDLNKFNQIISSYKEKMNMVDGNLESVGTGLHRARELVVQAANGVYTQDERITIAMEIDQIIRQLVSDANTEYKGNPLFSGTSSQSQPYRITENFDENTNNILVSNVEYTGNAQEKVMDIGKNDRITSVLPGSAIFETAETILQSDRDVSGYIVNEDSMIMIEGQEIHILQGDNIETIAQKINNLQLSVKASIETTTDGISNFRLSSLSARQPWLKDLSGGSILQDLGIIDGGIEGPKNYSTEAIVKKESIFETLLNIKENLLDNNILKLGGETLGKIDQSLNNIVKYRAYTGAVAERLERTFARNETEKLYLKNSASNAVHTDVIKSITELKMAEFAHQTALNIGAKLMPTTLMDFLR